MTTESAEQPLLAEQSVEPKKAAAKRRPATAKTATKTKAPAAKATAVKAAAAPKATATKEAKPKAAAKKTPAKKTTKKSAAKDNQPELLNLDTPEVVAAPVVEAPEVEGRAVIEAPEPAPVETKPEPVVSKPAPAPRRPAPAPVRTPVVTTTLEAEEWRPSARREREAAPAPAPTAPPAPAPVPAAPAPVEAPAPAAVAPAPAPVVSPAPNDPNIPVVRPRPVYIPRHVAKQMEEQARLSGDPNPVAPISMPAEEAPRIEVAPREEEIGEAEGLVEVSGKGFGFLRDPKRGFVQHPNDVFVTPEICRTYGLRDGQWLKGETRRGNRGSQIYRVAEINGEPAQNQTALPAFDELTVISPMERIVMETTSERYTTRVIDLMAPIGKGQRGLIVAPPRTGKTTLLQHIADALVKKHPDIKLIILLVDERPEEVTDIKRTVPTAEVMASSNDLDVKSHTRIAQLAIERAKRLVEAGKDVFVLLDSITRVGRAFNNSMGGGGRTMSGGMDSRALEIPRRLFAAARNTEEAGSLTVIATALIDTGSKMDELIFQEFKGTGNMELVLDRKISDQRIYPAVDIFQSGTRREELLIPADALHKIHVIRRGLAGHKPLEAMERLLFFLRKFPTNDQMLREIPG